MNKKTSNIKEISAYQTTDGAVFSVRECAETHQLYLDVVDCLDDDSDNDSLPGFSDAEEIIDWIVAHRDIVMRIIDSKECHIR